MLYMKLYPGAGTQVPTISANQWYSACYFWPNASPMSPVGNPELNGIVAGQLYDPYTPYIWTQVISVNGNLSLSVLDHCETISNFVIINLCFTFLCFGIHLRKWGKTSNWPPFWLPALSTTALYLRRKNKSLIHIVWRMFTLTLRLALFHLLTAQFVR